jgi:hypothetical protein
MKRVRSTAIDELVVVGGFLHGHDKCHAHAPCRISRRSFVMLKRVSRFIVEIFLLFVVFAKCHIVKIVVVVNRCIIDVDVVTIEKLFCKQSINESSVTSIVRLPL